MSQRQIVPIKIIVLGDMNVGKTSLITNYFERRFNENLPATIGASLNTQVIEDRMNKLNYHLNVWDTCGMERYMAVNSTYCRDANVVILVIDCSSSQTLQVAEHYLEMVNDICMGDPPILLAVTKIDLLPGYHDGVQLDDELFRTCVFYQKIQDFAQQHKVTATFWVSPAAGGVGVQSIFDYIIDNLLVIKTGFGGQRLTESNMPPPARGRCMGVVDYLWGWKSG